MTVERGATLLALRCDALAETGERVLSDLLGHFDPDLVYVPRAKADVRVVSRLRRAFDGPVIDAGRLADARTETVRGVSLRFAGSTAALEPPAVAESGDPPEGADYVVCDDLEPVTDAVELDAGLAGRETIARYQARTDGPTTFLTGSLEASYDHVWSAAVDGERVRLPVRGVAPLRRSGEPELARLTCDSDGSVAVTSVPADRFGLRALSGVGPTTAARLGEHGYDSRDAVAEASVDDLRSIDGIGEATARTVRGSARAISASRVVRRTDEPVPPASARPLFVDIETDGLHPTVVWLVGVYDPERDAYLDFVDVAPSRDDPGAATREFVSWLAAEYDRPSLVAWNGHAFDYKHLGRFVARYAPGYRDYWDDRVFTYDLYDWAVRREHAFLPGRTNRLADVAAALGRDREGPATAVDGRSLARRVRRLLETPADGDDRDSRPVPEPDWEAARRYCEADVRDLAAIHDALAAATPAEATTGTDDETTQTGLTDF